MAIALLEDAPDKVLKLLEELQAVADPYAPLFDAIDFGKWAEIDVYIPHPKVASSITPPFMEAFLEVQKQIYQLAAQATAGIADTSQLSEGERTRLQINVVVTGGSSKLQAKLEQTIPELLKTMIGKMTPKQATIVVVCVAVLAAGTWSFSAWLDQRKTIQLEELKSKDHIEALKALSLGAAGQTEALKKIVAVLEKQGEIGARALEAVNSTNEALLKAASKTRETAINGTHLTGEEAELLRTSPRKKSEVRVATQRMKVVDINTNDPNELGVVISTPDKKTQYRIKFVDSLFSGPDRKALFDALDSREAIWMELAFKESEGDVRSVQLIRTTSAPNIADADAEDK
ncbi:hypothetical protein [Bradyrhizobium sp. 191]|uniref:hypothetical protein n=1 Tax=Bradyrhizobium sp. 191 TaxID=2782659 RepID=UPI0020001D01|nr:hypothetical protein [Bradyrhizobium sp. 191]UPJ65976.1 hypothetical protein IVB23_00870 [Bradyrhizobium sp. 191]